MFDYRCSHRSFSSNHPSIEMSRRHASIFLVYTFRDPLLRRPTGKFPGIPVGQSATGHDTEIFNLLTYISVSLLYCCFRMSRKPTLDLEHGFLRGIRRQLQQRADELGLPPNHDDTHANHTNTNASHANTAAQASSNAVQQPPGRI